MLSHQASSLCGVSKKLRIRLREFIRHRNVLTAKQPLQVYGVDGGLAFVMIVRSSNDLFGLSTAWFLLNFLRHCLHRLRNGFELLGRVEVVISLISIAGVEPFLVVTAVKPHVGKRGRDVISPVKRRT